MDFLRIAGATLNQTPLDVVGNTGRIIEAMRSARSQKAHLLCLPELCVSGYGCEDAFFSAELTRACEHAVQNILAESEGLTVILGFPCLFSGALYNCAGILQDKKILGIHPKRALAREGVHYEPRWFRPWEFGRKSELEFLGAKVPFGDFIYQLGSMCMAIEICEEAWMSVPGAALAADEVHLIVNPSASHFALGKYQTRETLVANSSRAMHATYLYTNLLGCEAGRLIYDGGVLIAEKGQIVARGPRFGLKDGYVTTYDCYPEGATTEKLKQRSVYFGAGAHRDPGLTGDRTMRKIIGKEARQLHQSRHHTPPQATTSDLLPCNYGISSQKIDPDHIRNWEFLHAEILGLFDYLRKSRHLGFVISLSGGVDSATCAVLIAHMVAEGLKQLGPDELARRLGVMATQGDEVTKNDPRKWVHHLLVCIYQKTAQSGPVTQNAAQELALEIGAEFYISDIEPIVQSYVALAKSALGYDLTWKDHDLALQNIQARTRSPLPWLLANVRRSLLITTSNRSEASVGYATMDGDTSGGLAPLAGIDKPFLRQWLCWAEDPSRAFSNVPAPTQLPFGPIRALGLVNSQKPTAELRPTDASKAAQTDEDDLMPYPILEKIERYFVRDRLGPQDITQLVSRDFPNLPYETMERFVQKFMTLWNKSQWKRERLAPSFHLDEVSLDPKSYCRFPILT